MLEPVSFPLAELLHLEVTDIGEGRAHGTVDIGPDAHNPNGVAHGAVLFALADTLMGAAALSVLRPGQRCATVEAQIRFHRPVRDGRVHGVAEVVDAGRRIVHLSARMTTEEGMLVATATSTYTVLDPQNGSTR